MNKLPGSGPRRIVHPDGTVQMVFAGPNAVPRPPRLLRMLRRALWDTLSALAYVIGVIGGGLLALEYSSLTMASRLACGGALAGILALYLLARIARRRRVRS